MINQRGISFYRYSVLLVCLLGVWSCSPLINDVELDNLPVSKPLIVTHGFLSPQDSLITVRVTYSSAVFGTKPINQTTPNSIADLGFKVTVSDGSKTITLPYTARNSGSLISNYETSAKLLPIVAGKKYTLKVVAKNGETVEGSCVIPALVAIKEVVKDSIIDRIEDTNKPIKVPIYSIKWQDLKGKGNYYRFSGSALEKLRIVQANNVVREEFRLSNILFEDRYGDFQTDEHIDGGMLTSGIGRYNGIGLNTPAGTLILSRQIELVLVSCEKAYYDYHRAVQSYQGSNPFAEPSLTPSNIKNGLGCFAGYNKSVVYLNK